MSLESHVPGSSLYAGPTVDAPPASSRRTSPSVPRRGIRRMWVPIHHDTDLPARERRLNTVHRDIALHMSGDACTGCGQRAWLSGGSGCTCPSAGMDLEKRCLEAANRVRLAGDPWRRNAAAMPPTVRPPK